MELNNIRSRFAQWVADEIADAYQAHQEFIMHGCVNSAYGDGGFGSSFRLDDNDFEDRIKELKYMERVGLAQHMCPVNETCDYCEALFFLMDGK